MAITAHLPTSFGETRDLYVRLNNLETANHGLPSTALFRGFLSREAFLAGKGYVWEQEVRFTVDPSRPLWEQAYAAIKQLPLEELPLKPTSSDPETPINPAALAAWEKAAAEVEERNALVHTLAGAQDLL